MKSALEPIAFIACEVLVILADTDMLEEVQDIVRDVQAADRMQFKPSILGAIFADEP
ncbi:MAG: hypothetical protein ACRERE_23830 [Candidatus Entotheonellia bacterium]